MLQLRLRRLSQAAADSQKHLAIVVSSAAVDRRPSSPTLALRRQLPVLLGRNGTDTAPLGEKALVGMTSELSRRLPRNHRPGRSTLLARQPPRLRSLRASPCDSFLAIFSCSQWISHVRAHVGHDAASFFLLTSNACLNSPRTCFPSLAAVAPKPRVDM